MKLENLIEALALMMNIGGGSSLNIVDAAGNDLWRGAWQSLIGRLLHGLTQT